MFETVTLFEENTKQCISLLSSKKFIYEDYEFYIFNTDI